MNDWKNTTRCKYRRSLSGEKDIQMTSLELKALDLFGKAPNVNAGPDQFSINLKIEKDEMDEGVKDFQAAVEEAISDNVASGQAHSEEEEEEEEIQNEEQEEEIITDQAISGTVSDSNAQQNTTTYSTIVVENTNYDDDPNDEQLEFINHRRTTNNAPTITAISSGGRTSMQAPTGTTVTKLINGEMPLKRLRTHAPAEHIVYECKLSIKNLIIFNNFFFKNLFVIN